MKKLLQIFIGLGFILTPFYTNVHVKWFTEAAPKKETIENILSPLFMGLALLAAVVLASLTLFIPKMAQWPLIKKWDDFLSGFRKYSRYILKYGTAATLIIQVTYGTLFAPEFHIESPWMTILAWGAIGLLLMPHYSETKFGASLLLILFIMVKEKRNYILFKTFGWRGLYLWLNSFLNLFKNSLKGEVNTFGIDYLVEKMKWVGYVAGRFLF